MLLTVFDALDASASQTSQTFDVSGISALGAIFVQAGGSSIHGTAAILGSIDVPPYGASPGTGWNPSNWIAFPSSGTFSQAVTTPGTYPLGGNAGSVKWLQVTWTYTSGTGGTISCNLFLDEDATLSG